MAGKKAISLISQDFWGETRGALSLGIWGIGVSVAKVEVKRDVADGWGSKS